MGCSGRLAAEARPGIWWVPVEAIALCQEHSASPWRQAPWLAGRQRSIARCFEGLRASICTQGWGEPGGRSGSGVTYRLNCRWALGHLRPGAPLLDPTAGLQGLANGQVVAVAEAKSSRGSFALAAGITSGRRTRFRGWERKTLDWIRPITT